MGDTSHNITPAKGSQGWHNLEGVFGKPYAFGGRGPDSFDCWGLVHFCMRKFFKLDPPQYPSVMGETQKIKSIQESISSSVWQEIERPEPGCMVAMGRSKQFNHVGIWFANDGGICLHVVENQFVSGHSLQQLKAQNIRKFKFLRLNG